MHRLFVALRPPPAIRAALLQVMGGVPGARWQ
ncbi:MAG: RNA 2',3'-cyclic phosphodiesterase, partial [Proteobacteria bacterium]|nr:RNA 2',3'-cyclic phosphodiesterase [Pseudomonadota bacterium]